YDPAAVGDPHRYRPASIAVWNGLVWHTLGAPGSLVGPNLWNTVRILLYVGCATALGFALLPRALPRRGRIALAAGLPALVLATPGFGPDFARFGPAEPLLVGGMIGGALLLVLGLRGGLAGSLVVGTATQWAAMTVALESPVWAVLSLVAVGLTVRALRHREPLDWLVAGFVLTGWAALAFQALSRAEIVSRYYLPSVTLFGAATALALARSRPSFRRGDVAAVSLVLVLGAFGSYWNVRTWAANEREGNALV